MSGIQQMLLAGGGALSVSTVFSITLYTGDGSSRTVTTGIAQDLAWIKGRSGATDHVLYDTARGTTKQLIANTTDAQSTQAQGVTSFGTSSVDLGTLAALNTNTATYAVLGFKKAEKFFDRVLYTGDGTQNRDIAHALGVQPSLEIIKAYSTTGNWMVGSQTTAGTFLLNTTAARDSVDGSVGYTDESIFRVSTASAGEPSNIDTVNYVAYIFAKDTTASGLVTTGDFLTNGSGAATITGLLWAPQFLLLKTRLVTGPWIILDTTRGWASGNDALLTANTADAETSSTDYGAPTSDGFTVSGLSASASYFWVAIRAP